ncbi:unnamed protein product, partial [Brenthis ino]
MFVTNCLSLALFLYIFDSVHSRIIKFEEIPISSGELTLKFVPNKDTSGENIGKLIVLLRNKDKIEPKTKTMPPEVDQSFIPDLLNKVGIVAEKCPIDYKRVGFMCLSNKKTS